MLNKLMYVPFRLSFLLFVASFLASAQSMSSLTVVNNAEEHALVRVSGPSSDYLAVDGLMRQTTALTPGTYTLYSCWGTVPGHYRFSKLGHSIYVDAASQVTLVLRAAEGNTDEPEQKHALIVGGIFQASRWRKGCSAAFPPRDPGRDWSS